MTGPNGCTYSDLARSSAMYQAMYESVLSDFDGKSGVFSVRVAKSLHKALELEAEREGVSLNHLVCAKLAQPLSRILE